MALSDLPTGQTAVIHSVITTKHSRSAFLSVPFLHG